MVELMEIDLKRIRPNRLNPRLGMNVDRLNELADSIKQIGLLEPIIVRPVGSEYEVVVGERRYRASQQIGLQKVPAIVAELTDQEVIEFNLIENIQREDLNAVEKGFCCKRLLEEYPEQYPKKETLAERVGVSAGSISNWLKLTEAPEEIQRLVASTDKQGVPRDLGKLDYSTAVTITRQIEEEGRQIEVAREIAASPVHGRRARRVIEKAAEEQAIPVREIIKEVVDEPCEIYFSSENRDGVLKGQRTQITQKNAPDSRVSAGAVVHATVLEPRFAELMVTSLERTRLKHFTEEDALAECGYTLAEFKKIWTEKHGEWDENQLVHVIRFRKI